MVERSALDAVVFDAGGTLVRLDFEWIAAMLATLGVETTPALLRRAEIAGRRRYDEADRAGTSPRPHTDAYFTGLLASAGLAESRLAEGLEQMHVRQRSEHLLWARPMEGARAAIDAVRALGLRACCVSNSDGRAEEHLVRYGVREGLEFVVDSSRVGVEKPEPRIFAIALERLRVMAGRALYVGDLLSVDAAGASAAGMPYVIVDPFLDYAPPGTPRIAAMGELGEHLQQRFLTPASGERRASSP